MNLTKTIAEKLVETIRPGLCSGLGEPIPGQMCVEAAINFACGMKHGDKPTCVGPLVNQFYIYLNDCPWSSDAVRAKELLRGSIAQLGSDSIDQEKFKELLVFKGITKIQPFYIRKYAEKYSDELKPSDKEKILALANEFESAKDVDTVKKIIADNKGFGVGFGVGFGFGVGVGVGFGFGFGVGFGFGFGVGVGVGVGFGFGEFEEFFGDEFLIQVAGIAVECLIELKSPGCEWLDLCEVKSV